MNWVMEVLNIRMPSGYKAALRSLAAKEGETMSVVLRRLIREAASRQGIRIENRLGPKDFPTTEVDNDR